MARTTRTSCWHFGSSFSSRAIENSDFAIINVLLDFGFRLQAVSRPSTHRHTPVIPTIDTVVRRVEEKRANPIEWHLGSPNGESWLEASLHTNEDTPLLAAIRKNLLGGDVFTRLIEVLIALST